ncbi:lysozyme-like domain-containing protein [Kickxella alabastrina]|uniref:lysozyme-like domain-containing protein n=2 Tax=Kickxella alabastrina TaxID=61397 RepID=UPI00221F4682|nr:lysozyme-like domain-containing protein [Kickxella alabastrina]KAI7834422.1 lysozyme-like domain-containing protein [Kickxella alabastrina]
MDNSTIANNSGLGAPAAKNAGPQSYTEVASEALRGRLMAEDAVTLKRQLLLGQQLRGNAHSLHHKERCEPVFRDMENKFPMLCEGFVVMPDGTCAIGTAGEVARAIGNIYHQLYDAYHGAFPSEDPCSPLVYGSRTLTKDRTPMFEPANVSVNAELADCPKNLAFQLTNVFQFGDIKSPYGNCELDTNGSGYSSGVANFNTAAGDTWQVIQAYHNLTGGNDEFSKYNTVLGERAKNRDGSIAGLEGFCDAWKALALNTKFISAQGTVYDNLYFTPSQTQAKTLGLKLSVSLAAFYDTAVSRGSSDSAGSLGGIIKEAKKKVTSNKTGDSKSNLKINGYTIDEIEWLKMFLDVRAKYDSIGKNVNIKSYKYIIEQKQYTWVDKIDVLNNKGKPGDVTCENSYNPFDISPGQKINSLALCGNSCSEVESKVSKSRLSSASGINNYGHYAMALCVLAAFLLI